MRVLGQGIVLKEVLLFIARLTFESGRNPVVCVTIQMKPLLVEFSHGAIYFSSNFVVLTFESLNEILWCDHSNIYMVLYRYRCISNFSVCRRNL